MSDQSLRAALLKITGDLVARAEEGEPHLFLTVPLRDLEELLAAHPAEPAPVVAVEAVMAAHTALQERWGPLSAVPILHSDIRAALEAAAPLLGPRPLLDRDALGQVLISFGADMRIDADSPAVMLGHAVDAVLALARPMPDVQVGYDAVYEVIRNRQQSERPSVVQVNALMWRAVHAFIEAMGIESRPELKLDGSGS